MAEGHSFTYAKLNVWLITNVTATNPNARAVSFANLIKSKATLSMPSNQSIAFLSDYSSQLKFWITHIQHTV